MLRPAGVAPVDDRPRRFRHLIVRCMAQPDRFLAAALAELTDDVLAAAVGALMGQVYRLRLMGWPRADQWDHDVYQMAMAIGADPGLLDGLLRSRLGG
jgi:hypothetical protein